MTNQIILLASIVLLMVQCVDVNTTDTQASSSISRSKQNGVYISSAHKINPGVLDIVDSVWCEKLWKYDIVKGQTKKTPLNYTQIVLQLKKSQKLINFNNYLTDWKISEKHYGDLGSGNGVFSVLYSEKQKTDTFRFLVKGMNNDSIIDIGTFAKP